MTIQELSLTNFKNYQQLHVRFHDKVNFLLGKNGSGKTNLLDAIYYTSFTKSSFNFTESENINHHTSFKSFAVQSKWDKKDKPYEIQYVVKENQKKLFINQVHQPKITQHVGCFPVVFHHADDKRLIEGGSTIRRKFINHTLVQTNPRYLNVLIEYNKYLKQRNSLLKNTIEYKNLNWNLLNIYDQKLYDLGQEIFTIRKLFFTHFLPYFYYYHFFLTARKELSEITMNLKDIPQNLLNKNVGEEKIKLAYNSHYMHNGFKEVFSQNILKDYLAGNTLLGVHKDDIIIYLNDYMLKKIGSQGQQQSVILALRFAESHYIYQITGIKPIMLLDDILDKIDEHRIQKLFKLINKNYLGQLFITESKKGMLNYMHQNIKEGSAFYLFNNRLRKLKMQELPK